MLFVYFLHVAHRSCFMFVFDRFCAFMLLLSFTARLRKWFMQFFVLSGYNSPFQLRLPHSFCTKTTSIKCCLVYLLASSKAALFKFIYPNVSKKIFCKSAHFVFSFLFTNWFSAYSVALETVNINSISIQCIHQTIKRSEELIHK